MPSLQSWAGIRRRISLSPLSALRRLFLWLFGAVIGEALDRRLTTVDLVIRPIRLLAQEGRIDRCTLVRDVDERSNQVDFHRCRLGLESGGDLLGEGIQQAAHHGLLLCSEVAAGPVSDGSQSSLDGGQVVGCSFAVRCVCEQA